MQACKYLLKAMTVTVTGHLRQTLLTQTLVTQTLVTWALVTWTLVTSSLCQGTLVTWILRPDIWGHGVTSIRVTIVHVTSVRVTIVHVTSVRVTSVCVTSDLEPTVSVRTRSFRRKTCKPSFSQFDRCSLVGTRMNSCRSRTNLRRCYRFCTNRTCPSLYRTHLGWWG